MTSQAAHDLFLRAQQHYDSRHYQSAIEDLNEAIRLEPLELKYYWLRASCWMRVYNVQAHMDDLSMMLNLTTDVNWLAKAHRVRLSWYKQQGQFENAILEGKWLVDHDAADDQVHQFMALCYDELGQFEEAILHFSAAIELLHSPVPLMFRAKLYIKIGKYVEAIQDLSEALEKCGDTYKVQDVILRVRGEVHYQADDKAKALEDFNRYGAMQGLKPFSSADAFMQRAKRLAEQARRYRAAQDDPERVTYRVATQMGQDWRVHKMLERERREFAEAVEKAFAGTKYPGDDDIVYKSNTLDDDREITLRSFRGKQWKEVALDTLILCRDHLPQFTPKAYRYYLPAFMIASIVQYEEVDVLSNNTLYSLSPFDSEDLDYSDFIERVTGFDPEQKDAIRMFLELYTQLDPLMIQIDPRGPLQRAIEFWEGFDA